MRSPTLALVVVALVSPLLAASAAAQPVTVNVRIEGREKTLFEGPVRTEAHEIEASSGSEPHVCNGTNAHRNATPGATPTVAAVDAMSIIAEASAKAGEAVGWDGIWEGGFEDFKVTRFGPDEADAETDEFWTLLVDQTETKVGGCQVELAEGDQVLWVYNGFANRPFLTLFAGSEASGAAVPTATVKVDEPLTVSVDEYKSSEGVHVVPKPYTGGAEIAPVKTAANGFQTVEVGSPEAVTTGPKGSAVATFTTPGWHRLKAEATKAFRSNRLDVCVLANGASECGPPPADDEVRSPPPLSPPSLTPPVVPTQSTSAPSSPSTNPSGAVGATVANKPPADELDLDGLELTPLSDRSSALHYHGRWRRVREAGSFSGAVAVGGAGASVSVRLAAGRPVFIVRDVHRRARVDEIVGRHTSVHTIPASGASTSRTLELARRGAGTVELKILAGTVGIDGVAVTP